MFMHDLSSTVRKVRDLSDASLFHGGPKLVRRFVSVCVIRKVKIIRKDWN